jgi:hypothetical protein
MVRDFFRNGWMRIGLALVGAWLLTATLSLADEIPVDPAQNPPSEGATTTGALPPEASPEAPAGAAPPEPMAEPGSVATPTCVLALDQDVSIQIETVGPSLSQDSAIADLTREMAAGPPRPGLERYNHALGVTDTDIRTRARVVPQGRRQSVGSWCVKLTRVDIVITFGIEVHLAQELQPGSCPYRAVLQHEQKHVAVAQGLKQSLRDQVEAAVVDAIKRPVLAVDRETGAKLAEAAVDHFLRDTVAAWKQASETYQMQIDTPQEYDRVHAICGDTAFGKLMHRQF